MDIVKNFIDSYMDFHYGLGLAIATIVFVILLIIKVRIQRSQGKSISKTEVFWCVAFSIYIVVLLGGTILNRQSGDKYRIKLVPFWSYYDAIANRDTSLIIQMVYNILVFVPYGILIPEMWDKMKRLSNTVVSATLLSFMIEVVQLFLKRGLFEFDDMFHNALGAVIGYEVWKCWGEFRRSKTHLN